MKAFQQGSLSTFQQQGNLNPMNLTPFMKRMQIYCLGGGNITAIFSLLHDQTDRDQIHVLEEIISLYPLQPH
uniref:Uncharacterized protein n=1 Tax=Anguilla anguilla TaxID=7936 RepID=A0A0E9TX05_ANGAN